MGEANGRSKNILFSSNKAAMMSRGLLTNKKATVLVRRGLMRAWKKKRPRNWCTVASVSDFYLLMRRYTPTRKRPNRRIQRRSCSSW